MWWMLIKMLLISVIRGANYRYVCLVSLVGVPKISNNLSKEPKLTLSGSLTNMSNKVRNCDIKDRNSFFSSNTRSGRANVLGMQSAYWIRQHNTYQSFRSDTTAWRSFPQGLVIYLRSSKTYYEWAPNARGRGYKITWNATNLPVLVKDNVRSFNWWWWLQQFWREF